MLLIVCTAIKPQKHNHKKTEFHSQHQQTRCTTYTQLYAETSRLCNKSKVLVKTRSR